MYRFYVMVKCEVCEQIRSEIYVEIQKSDTFIKQQYIWSHSLNEQRRQFFDFQIMWIL